MMETVRVFNQRDYMQAQIAVALGPENCWYAGQVLGREPTINEALAYFVACGAADRFSADHLAEYMVDIEVSDPTEDQYTACAAGQ